MKYKALLKSGIFLKKNNTLKDNIKYLIKQINKILNNIS